MSVSSLRTRRVSLPFASLVDADAQDTEGIGEGEEEEEGKGPLEAEASPLRSVSDCGSDDEEQKEGFFDLMLAIFCHELLNGYTWKRSLRPGQVWAEESSIVSEGFCCIEDGSLMMEEIRWVLLLLLLDMN